MSSLRRPGEGDRGCSQSEMGLFFGSEIMEVHLPALEGGHGVTHNDSVSPAAPLSGNFSWHSCPAFDRYLPDSLSGCRGLNVEGGAVNPIIGEKRRIGEFEAFIWGFERNRPRYIRFPENNR